MYKGREVWIDRNRVRRCLAAGIGVMLAFSSGATQIEDGATTSGEMFKNESHWQTLRVPSGDLITMWRDATDFGVHRNIFVNSLATPRWPERYAPASAAMYYGHGHDAFGFPQQYPTANTLGEKVTPGFMADPRDGVPEPASIIIFGMGLAGMVRVSRARA